ncbi:MAG TPA: methyltransferase domain-containing protein [Pyrinomonadaceae bacterium]|nr:methyltransferase domain-containing protein [Pyrinomonadaceae bacterium]
MSRANGAGREVERAVAAMLHEFRDNHWMLDEHWPLNEPHIRLMISDVLERFPPGPRVRLLDVGCFNGYASLIFSRLGYSVTGTDVYESAERDALFAREGVEFVRANMNDLRPLAQLDAASFDIVIIAQVIEHILNHPLGLIRGLAGSMRGGGVMILTTPNPVTVMGAARVIRGRSLLWGTTEFIDEPKIDGEKVISQGDIHYREYTSAELRHMLAGAGLRVERSRYLGLGNSRSQPVWKRFAKGNPLARRLMSHRLFGSNHYLLARKP